jgi:hypothetical protein
MFPCGSVSFSNTSIGSCKSSFVTAISFTAFGGSTANTDGKVKLPERMADNRMNKNFAIILFLFIYQQFINTLKSTYWN